ncbi:A disintegrin and metalloproteinase with thrombospondin motifs like isoform X2 [Anabrus simplex]|uniref:A disintegrin and metalloproteinase with thrombospondin motifs like isoform X2 n=1 Tax=Anabrus simplex TaxID=316456 RepID=UPI0035A291D4
MATFSFFSVITLLAWTNELHAASSLVHEHMSTTELRHVFQVDSHEQVPQYEVVRLRSFTKRSIQEGTHSVQLSAFGRDLQLRLQRTSGLFKGDDVRMWAADLNSTSPHQLEYTELPKDEEDIGEVYQDEENEAALLLHRDRSDGGLLMEGTIGHDLVLKPVPARVRQHLDDNDKDESDDEMFLDEEGEDIANDVAVKSGFPLRRDRRSASVSPHHHIVYRRSGAENKMEALSDYAFMEPDRLAKRMRKKRSINKREAPYVIYPEILVIVDYDGYRLHGGDNVQIKRYFVSFWNGVDLRYKLLKGPKIRISIAGIIISRGRDATPYLERNRVGRDAIDSAAALTDMGKYLFRERRLPVYDIAVAVTKYDMCRRRKGGRCTKGTAGFAYVGGACVVNKRLEKVNSVAIIEDTGGFSGIIVGAHEVGHLLGAVHDGSPPPSYLGGPGAEKCRWEDGYIMSDLRHTEKGFRWSSCSVASFHHFLNGDTATCLYNSPHEDESLPRVLPGKLLTLDAQCRKDRGTSACFKDDRVCAQLFCFDAGSGYCVAYRPAAEGSPCGDGQYCLNGRCVAEHENIIPDYSQNTPSYIRRNDADSAATQSRPVYANPPNITRSPWDEFRSTGSSTTTPFPFYNPTSTTRSPYNYYSSTTQNPYTSTTQNPYSTTNRYQYYTSTTQNHYDQYYKAKNSIGTTEHPYSYKYNQYSTTTKNPYDFSNFDKKNSAKNSLNSNSDIYGSSTTRNPYAVFNFYSSTTNKPSQYNNVYQSQTTTRKYQSHYFSSASNNEPSIINRTNSESNITGNAADTECEDKATKLGGSMTCREFLSHYGYQYCSYQYMRRNCCVSQREVCDRSRRKRR